MWSDSLQQQVVLAVHLRLRHDVVQRPTQSVCPSWTQKDRVVAHHCSEVPRTECQLSFARGTVSPMFRWRLCWNRVVVITETATYVPFAATPMVQHSLNVGRSVQHTPRSVQQADMMITMSEAVCSGLQHVFGRVKH